MTRCLRTLAIPLLLAALPARGQDGGAKPDLDAVAKAGRASIARFQSQSASWTVTTDVANGIRFHVDVIAGQGKKRAILSAEKQGRRQEFARIIEKDGAWFVVQGSGAGKYRPFEVPLDVPTAYMYLNHSDPQFITEAVPAGLGTFEASKDGIATFRMPLPDAAKAQLTKVLADFDRFKKDNPEQAAKPEVERSVEAIQDLLSRGIATDVEMKTGLLTRFGAPERRTTFADFRWLPRVDPEVFATEGTKWDDHSDDPTAGDRGDLLMIGHCLIWRPGMKPPETDGRLIDVETGRFRRVPFRGDQAAQGCFSADRTRVIISGLDGTKGVLGLYEIDLKTGQNRQLGGDRLASGFTLFPSLSPDGKTVAVLHKAAGSPILESQICLVDLASGEAKALGKPLDTGPVSWFPDGRGLLMVERKIVDMKKPSVDTICRMGLDGTITRLIPGHSPLMLGDGERILFEDQETREWKTCKLDGGDVKTYADGMKGHAFPAPAPDGKRILWMHFEEGKAPEPLVFEVDGTKGKTLTTAAGLWANPSWR